MACSDGLRGPSPLYMYYIYYCTYFYKYPLDSYIIVATKFGYVKLYMQLFSQLSFQFNSEVSFYFLSFFSSAPFGELAFLLEDGCSSSRSSTGLL